MNIAPVADRTGVLIAAPGVKEMTALSSFMGGIRWQLQSILEGFELWYGGPRHPFVSKIGCCECDPRLVRQSLI